MQCHDERARREAAAEIWDQRAEIAPGLGSLHSANKQPRNVVARAIRCKFEKASGLALLRALAVCHLLHFM